MWQINQLNKLYQNNPDQVETAIMVFLRQNDELKEKIVIGAYLDENFELLHCFFKNFMKTG